MYNVYYNTYIIVISVIIKRYWMAFTMHKCIISINIDQIKNRIFYFIILSKKKKVSRYTDIIENRLEEQSAFIKRAF